MSHGSPHGQTRGLICGKYMSHGDRILGHPDRGMFPMLPCIPLKYRHVCPPHIHTNNDSHIFIVVTIADALLHSGNPTPQQVTTIVWWWWQIGGGWLAVT